MELKACPCCGSKAEILSGNIDASLHAIFGVGCPQCGICARGFHSQSEATEVWNKRA
jgi:Lar family restriction alleviation protein